MSQKKEEKSHKREDKLTEFLLYKSPNGDIKIDVYLHNETIWLPQKKIAQLFDVGVPAISKHLKNIFETNELDEKVVVSILEIPTQHGAIEGKNQVNQTRFYNLDAFLQFNEEEVLQNAGKVTAEIAKAFAENEFEKYRPIQDKLFESDFDREIKKLLEKKE